MRWLPMRRCQGFASADFGRVCHYVKQAPAFTETGGTWSGVLHQYPRLRQICLVGAICELAAHQTVSRPGGASRPERGQVRPGERAVPIGSGCIRVIAPAAPWHRSRPLSRTPRRALWPHGDPGLRSERRQAMRKRSASDRQRHQARHASACSYPRTPARR
jgi:hypothetical protein